MTLISLQSCGKINIQTGSIASPASLPDHFQPLRDKIHSLMSLTYLVRRTTVDLDVELAKGLTITQRVFNLEIHNMAHPCCRWVFFLEIYCQKSTLGHFFFIIKIILGSLSTPTDTLHPILLFGWCPPEMETNKTMMWHPNSPVLLILFIDDDLCSTYIIPGEALSRDSRNFCESIYGVSFSSLCTHPFCIRTRGETRGLVFDL